MARRARNDQQPRQSLCCVKFFIFLLLAGLSASSFFFYETLVELKAEIGTDESTIASLQNTVKAQQKIINRFNESVTNADVQRKVAELEGQLHTTESEMLENENNGKSERRRIHFSFKRDSNRDSTRGGTPKLKDRHSTWF